MMRCRSCSRAELLVLARHLQAMAVLVEAQPAPQRLGQVEVQRRRILRVQRDELVVGAARSELAKFSE